MTTKTALEKLLKNVKGFTGVFLYNEIDKIKRLDNECIIVNYITEEDVKNGKSGHCMTIDNRSGVTKGNKGHTILV